MVKYKSKSTLPLYKCHIILNKKLHYGLYGGSFNPVHEGHKAVAKYALKSGQLKQIIWLVTPQNPFKDVSIYRPYDERLEQVKKFTNYPSFMISNIEYQLDTRHTYQTLLYLNRRYPNVKFTFIIGSDSLVSMHKWHFFKFISQIVNFIIIVRPTHRFNIKGFQAIQYFKQNLINYRFTLQPFVHISSTKIRNGLALIS